MYRKLARVIGSVMAAALLALTLQACGDGGSTEKKAPEKKTEDTKTDDKKSGDSGASDVTYKCANAGCTKPTQTAAAGAPAPKC